MLSPCEEGLEALAKVKAKVQAFASMMTVTTVSGNVPYSAVSIHTETLMEQDKAPVIETEANSTSDSDL